MVHRLSNQDKGTWVFEGLLDREALQRLLRACASPEVRRLLLRSGTEVDAECIQALLALEVEVVAESPYLARWLQRAREEGGGR